MGDFINHIRDELRIPQIDGERCVHSLAECATCERCVKACPQQAWILDDEALKLNVDLCDGCGLCIPACSEGALSQDRPLPIRSGKWAKTLFLKCSKSRCDNSAPPIACLHTLGLRELVQCSNAKLSTIISTTGNCDTCSIYPSNQAMRLPNLVERFNQFLSANNLAELSLVSLDVKSFDKYWRVSPAFIDSGPVVSRRLFLRKAISETIDKTVDNALNRDIDHIVISQTQTADTAPALSALKDELTASFFAFAPRIDLERCNGCDACIRLCPHQALYASLASEQTREPDQYHIDAANCSGCNLCVDVCDQNAISIQKWVSIEKTSLALITTHCPKCGVRFHKPATHLEQVLDLCQVCEKIDHQQNLFQILR